MRDLDVVELVEGVLVDVLGVCPDEVVPYADVCGDLDAGPADVLAVLHRLRHVLPADALDHLTRSPAAGRTGSFAVADLVDLVQGVPARLAAA